MSSRLPGIIFIVFAIAVVAGIGYYAISSIGNYEISQENAHIAAITTMPTPYPTIVPQTREIKLTAAAPVTPTQVQEVVTARQVLAPLKSRYFFIQPITNIIFGNMGYYDEEN